MNIFLSILVLIIPPVTGSTEPEQYKIFILNK